MVFFLYSDVTVDAEPLTLNRCVVAVIVAVVGEVVTQACQDHCYMLKWGQL